MYSWNTTIDDTSSMLTYYPFADTASLTGGWMQWYSTYPGGFIKNPGDDESGNSLHITSTSGASVSLQFHGTAVYLYGSANCSYTVTLDGTQNQPTAPDNSSNLLFFQEGLSRTTHFVNVTASPTNTSEQFAFDNAVVTDTINQNVPNLIPVKIDNQNQTALQYTGNWSAHNDPQIPSKASPSPFMQTSAYQSSVSLNFTNAVAVAINADRDWGHWIYNVTLDGVSSQYNASTWWLIGDTILFYQSGLDPNETHQITLENLGDASYYQLALNDITYYQPNVTDLAAAPSSSSSSQSASSSTSTGNPTAAPASDATRHKVNAGAIAGPIVAVVVALLVALGLFLWWRRRHGPTAATRDSEDVSPFPPHERPDIWTKSSEANLNVSQSVDNLSGVPIMRKSDMGRIAPPPTQPVSSVTQTTAGISVEPPTTVGTPVPVQSSPASQSQPQTQSQPVDVNHIIELIAQRIDPGFRVSDVPPPSYPA